MLVSMPNCPRSLETRWLRFLDRFTRAGTLVVGFADSAAVGSVTCAAASESWATCARNASAKGLTAHHRAVYRLLSSVPPLGISFSFSSFFLSVADWSSRRLPVSAPAGLRPFSSFDLSEIDPRIDRVLVPRLRRWLRTPRLRVGIGRRHRRALCVPRAAEPWNESMSVGPPVGRPKMFSCEYPSRGIGRCNVRASTLRP